MLKNSGDDEIERFGHGDILVAIGGGSASNRIVWLGKSLADAFQTSWQAIHVETPNWDRDGESAARVSEALRLAAEHGASVATIPAATVADGLNIHIAHSATDQLVMGYAKRGMRLPWHRPALEDLMRRRSDVVIHLVPTESSPTAFRRALLGESDPLIRYGYAAATVALTLLAALVLHWASGVRSLSVLFLFPVIAAAARLGIKPALVAALLSTIAFNFFFLVPAYVLKPAAIQTWVMGALLAAVGLYTGIITAKLRGRIELSDRSAQENATLASFALQLTRVSDWKTTAETVCNQVSALLKVRTIVFREVSGSLEVAAAIPEDVSIGPVDNAALDWAWLHGEAAGSGTTTLSAADWQFQPLTTSLGTLAVLGLARDDGRSPVPADQSVLLATLIAQAALAHERLRLEDLMRASRPAEEM